MMTDTVWGIGATTSAPMMTGFGGIGFPDGGINGIHDDEIEGMIDGLGFFDDKDDAFSTPQSSFDINKSDSTTLLPKPLPIITNDTGAVVTVSDPSILPSTPRDVRSLNFATTLANKPKELECPISLPGLPQPPQLVTSRDSPVSCNTDNTNSSSSSNSSISFQSVLDKQRETILQNQKIIEAQQNELRGQIHQAGSKPPLLVPSLPAPTPTSHIRKVTATYPLARAALKKADEQIISGAKIARGTKRKAASPPATTSEAYQKWKLTPAGATKLKAVDSSALKSARNCNKQLDDTKDLTPGELEIRRERNRKHAKKSRLRKKSLTSDLEQSLEVLREENLKLRELIKDHIAKKKEASDAAANSVETLLQKHRVRSHERFIECILTNTRATKPKKKAKDTTSERKPEAKSSTDGAKCPSGKGVVVDDKTLKVLKGLSKSIASSTNKQRKQ